MTVIVLPMGDRLFVQPGDQVLQIFVFIDDIMRFAVGTRLEGGNMGAEDCDSHPIAFTFAAFSLLDPQNLFPAMVPQRRLPAIPLSIFQ